MRDDPFWLLGLPPWAGLTDDEVRAAWRRIAAATHPDREDGGDPVRYSAAAAAYAALRTSFGRGEALADRTEADTRAGRARTDRTWAARTWAGRTSAGRARAGQRRRARPPARHGVPGPGAHRLVTQPLAPQWLLPQRPGAHRHDVRQPDVRRLGAHRLAGHGLDLRPAVTPAVATALATATIAAVGVTPATIGLLTGALTVSGWALWRRGGWGQ